MTGLPAWLESLRTRMRGRVIGRDEADIVLANKQHAARLPFEPPLALVRCADRDDVLRASTACLAEGVAFSVRSGGHCFADRSTAAPVVLDLGGLDAIAPDGDVATIGTGATSGAAATALASFGRMIPTGGCPGVAVGGLALVGGFGFSGRRLGLLSDSVESFEVVLADGRVVTASEDDHADLFWGLRGGGTVGLGIVTAARIRTAAAVSGLACSGAWPVTDAPDLIARWQDWMTTAAPAVGIEISIVASDDLNEEPFVKMWGGIADDGGAEEHADELRRRLGPFAGGLRLTGLASGAFAEHLVGLRDDRGEPAWMPSFPYRQVGFQATRSQFLTAPFEDGRLEDVARRIGEDRTGRDAREIEIIPWGGAYARPSSDSAFVHRDAAFLVRHTGLGGSRCGIEEQAGIRAWADESWRMLRDGGDDRRYQGYSEPGRPLLDEACYGRATDRLSEIRNRYNPGRLGEGFEIGRD